MIYIIIYRVERSIANMPSLLSPDDGNVKKEKAMRGMQKNKNY